MFRYAMDIPMMSITMLSMASSITFDPPLDPVARDASIFVIVRFRKFCQYISRTYLAYLLAGTNPNLTASAVIFSHAAFFLFFCDGWGKCAENY